MLPSWLNTLLYSTISGKPSENYLPWGAISSFFLLMNACWLPCKQSTVRWITIYSGHTESVQFSLKKTPGYSAHHKINGRVYVKTFSNNTGNKLTRWHRSTLPTNKLRLLRSPLLGEDTHASTLEAGEHLSPGLHNHQGNNSVKLQNQYSHVGYGKLGNLSRSDVGYGTRQKHRAGKQVLHTVHRRRNGTTTKAK